MSRRPPAGVDVSARARRLELALVDADDVPTTSHVGTKERAYEREGFGSAEREAKCRIAWWES